MPASLPMVGIIVAKPAINTRNCDAAPIRLTLPRRDDIIEVAVADARPGLPADFDPTRSRCLGMRVAANLTFPLKGRLELDRTAPGGGLVLVIPAAA